ncbi:hypothetical protein NL676_011423 [Syzygium grande]|nr:hypothetical protein NL676_011423 [Syzygium grande]
MLRQEEGRRRRSSTGHSRRSRGQALLMGPKSLGHTAHGPNKQFFSSAQPFLGFRIRANTGLLGQPRESGCDRGLHEGTPSPPSIAPLLIPTVGIPNKAPPPPADATPPRIARRHVSNPFPMLASVRSSPRRLHLAGDTDPPMTVRLARVED